MNKLACLALVFTVGCATDSSEAEYDGFTAGAKADDPYGWSHVVLRSDDGIGFSIDYKSNFREDRTSYKPTHVDDAAPLYMNVWGDELTGSEQVRVVLMNYEACWKTSVPYVYQMDLQWQGDHFSGNVGRDAAIERSYLKWAPGSVPFTTRWSGYGGDHPWCQEAAVVVDGKWLVDPVSRKHNFAFDMYAQR